MNEYDGKRASLCVTLGQGDSVLLTGKDSTEVKIQDVQGRNKIRVVVIADKSVKITRNHIKKQEET